MDNTWFEKWKSASRAAKYAPASRRAPRGICTWATCARRSTPGASPGTQHGKFLLRIEDTDQSRQVEGAVEVIYSTRCADCGLDHDEGPDVGGPVGPYVQTERRDTYLHLRRAPRGSAATPIDCFCDKDRIRGVHSGDFTRKVRWPLPRSFRGRGAAPS